MRRDGTTGRRGASGRVEAEVRGPHAVDARGRQGGVRHGLEDALGDPAVEGDPPDPEVAAGPRLEQVDEHAVASGSATARRAIRPPIRISVAQPPTASTIRTVDPSSPAVPSDATTTRPPAGPVTVLAAGMRSSDGARPRCADRERPALERPGGIERRLGAPPGPRDGGGRAVRRARRATGGQAAIERVGRSAVAPERSADPRRARGRWRRRPATAGPGARSSDAST